MTDKNNANTNIKFFTRTRDAWDVMYADCQKAEKAIYFEQYIIANDQWGQKFLKLFLKKAQDGVDVRLVFDFIGSLDTRSSPFIKKIRKSGGKVSFYRPLKLYHLFLPHQWFPRTHLKCMIIDKNIGYMGSACIAEEMENWRDTYLRCTGSLVSEMMDEFGIHFDKKGDHPQIDNDADDDGLDFQLNVPEKHSNPVFENLLDHVEKAKTSIDLVTPYFIPPSKLADALIAAVSRGVTVRVMTSEESDVHMADLAGRDEFNRFLDAGIEIYLYKPTVIHAKYAIVDNQWATVGSTNIDYLSLYKNRESNLSVERPEIVKILRGHFDSDLPDCHKIDGEFMEKRPLKERLAGRLARLLKRIL